MIDPFVDDDDRIPTDRDGILAALMLAGARAESEDYLGAAEALQARLRAGERVPEVDRAAALGMSWGAYALIRGAELARRDGSRVRLYADDDGQPLLAIEVVAGIAEFRRGDGRLVLALAIEMIDRYVAAVAKCTVH